MIVFPAYASDFEVYPKDGEAYKHLSPLLEGLQQIEFTFHVENPSVNQGQMVSDFDEMLEKTLLSAGAECFDLRLPRQIPQELDFAFIFRGRRVAVEIEKSNREKILRDILKCHMYLQSGADFAIVGLPRNYPHKLGIWNLYGFGVDRLAECKAYGFGTADKLGKILLLGFTQFDAERHTALSTKSRQRMRKRAEQAVRG